MKGEVLTVGTITVGIDGSALRSQIHRRGLTQREFCRLAGLTEAALSRIIQRNGCRPDTLTKLRRGLNARPEVEGLTFLLAPHSAERRAA